MRTGPDRRRFDFATAVVAMPDGRELHVGVTDGGEVKVRVPGAVAVESVFNGGQRRPTIVTLVPRLRDEGT